MAMNVLRIPTSGNLVSDANGNACGSSEGQGLLEIQKILIKSTDYDTNGSALFNGNNVSGESLGAKLGIGAGDVVVYPAIQDTVAGAAVNSWSNPLVFGRIYVSCSGLGNAKKGYFEIFAEERV